MLNASKPLRRLGLLLAVLTLLCLAPTGANAASSEAESERYDYDVNVITIHKAHGMASVAVYVGRPGETFVQAELNALKGALLSSFSFKMPISLSHFYVEVTMTDGTVHTSELVKSSWNTRYYSYNIKTNVLNSERKAPPNISVLWPPLYFFVFFVVLPVLAGILAALLFRIKPLKHVAVIPLIAYVTVFGVIFGISESLLLAGLLLLPAIIVEYFLYRKKYPDQGKGKLLFYTILANALGFALMALSVGLLVDNRVY